MHISQLGQPATPVPAPARPVEEPLLIGRAAELDAVDAFLDDAAAGGGALVLRGETGAGRTALLTAAGRHARERGTAVLPVRGVAAGADLCSALGIGVPPRDRLQIRTGMLSALRAEGRRTALLVVIDDLQDLEEATAAALAFVARRLAGSRVGLLAAVRTDVDRVDGPAGIPQLTVSPLGDADAARLVRDHVPGLTAHLVGRVVAEAGGNPLALRELAAELARAEHVVLPWSAAPSPAHRPAARFASRIQDLPDATRSALLVAAVADPEPLLGSYGNPDVLEPAERAGLVEIDHRTGAIRFRHPLVRSTMRHLATPGERRTAHRTIAKLLVDRPEEHVTHIAAATVTPDERLARLVQRTAWRILRRGDAAAAAASLVRAAQLSRSGKARGRRVAAAASVVAHGTGDLVSVPRLLAAARRADPGHDSLSATVAQAYCLLNGGGQVVEAHRKLVTALTDDPDRERPVLAALDGLHLLVDAAASAGRPDLWGSVLPLVRLRAGDRSAGLCLRVSVIADPARVSPRDAASLDAAICGLSAESDPVRIWRVAAAAFALDRVAECREPLRRVVDAGRLGRAAPAAMASFALLSAGDIATGRWDEAGEIAEEGVALCERYGHHLIATRLRLGSAMIAAARGDETRARALADPVVRWAARRDIRAVVDDGRHVLALSALARGDAEEAYRQATAITPPGLLAVSSPAALRVSMDLVESAVRLGRWDEASRHVRAMRDAPVHAVSARFAMLTAASAALVAAPQTADALFDTALSAPDADRWPFDQARIQLAYGEYLRRQRRTDRSRVLLGAALDTFERLAARPWEAQARRGLRATGVTVGRSVHTGAVAALTPDERAVAVLAVAGLTNKQIARRLTVSHHTVAARLYQAFPKLGVGSRAALRDAMIALDGETGDAVRGAALVGIA